MKANIELWQGIVIMWGLGLSMLDRAARVPALTEIGGTLVPEGTHWQHWAKEELTLQDSGAVWPLQQDSCLRRKDWPWQGGLCPEGLVSLIKPVLRWPLSSQKQCALWQGGMFDHTGWHWVLSPASELKPSASNLSYLLPFNYTIFCCQPPWWAPYMSFSHMARRCSQLKVGYLPFRKEGAELL